MLGRKEIDEKFFKIKPDYETKYAEISNGEKIGYREAGTGPAIVLIHGGFQCSLTFEPLMKYLSVNYRCIAVCLRGSGYSSNEKSIESLKDFADD